MNQEHLERFKIVCGYDGENPYFHLSKDHCMGILKDERQKEVNIIFFGTLKLKKRPSKRWIKVGNIHLDRQFLQRAMKILHRRKYISLGILDVDDERENPIFFLKEGDNNVVIAPAFPSYSDNEYYVEDILDIIEPTTASGLLMSWLCYAKVFDRGKKID